jgi:hypothetical protein
LGVTRSSSVKDREALVSPPKEGSDTEAETPLAGSGRSYDRTERSDREEKSKGDEANKDKDPTTSDKKDAVFIQPLTPRKTSVAINPLSMSEGSSLSRPELLAQVLP